jgi:HK97 family phage portal protein
MKILGLTIGRNKPVEKTTGSFVPAGGWWSIVRDWYQGAWQKNDEIKVDTVLAQHAVYSCITLISNDIGKLRPMVVEQTSDGIWVETKNENLSPLLRKPNRFQNRIQFIQWWIISKLIHGNTYVLKARNNRGVVTAMYILDPLRTWPMVAPDGSVFYQLSTDNLAGIQVTDNKLMVPASEIIHDRMNCLFHPLVGVSPLYAAGRSANLALTILNNSSKFFQNASRPSGLITAPGSISGDSAKALKEQWDKNFSGDNSGSVAVVGDGLKFDPMRMNAVDSQLIEQLKWNSEVVCSTFHVPPYKLGLGAPPAINNIEALNQEYYGQALQILIEEMEECLDFGLGLDTPIAGKQLGIELDLEPLLRMDTPTLIDTMGKAVTNSIVTTDEARRKLNLPKVKGGDVIWRQQQYYSLAALDERDRNNPFPEKQPPTPDNPQDQTATNEKSLAAALPIIRGWIQNSQRCH